MEETIILTDALASDVGAGPSVYISCSFHFEFVLQVFELRRGRDNLQCFLMKFDTGCSN